MRTRMCNGVLGLLLSWCVPVLVAQVQEQNCAETTACAVPLQGAPAMVAQIQSQMTLAGPNDSVRASEVQNSAYQGFEEFRISVQHDDHVASTPVFVSTNGAFFAFGSLYDLREDPRTVVSRAVKSFFAIPEGTEVAVTRRSPSILPGLVSWTVSAGSADLSRTFLSTADGVLIAGPVLFRDGWGASEIRRSLQEPYRLSTSKMFRGVEIVEFGDLQCPACNELHLLLKEQIGPRFADHVRIVDKAFPMTRIHPWALLASRISYCVGRSNPSANDRFRNEVFSKRDSIATDHPEEDLLRIVVTVGADADQIKTCASSKESLAAVQRDVLQGGGVGVMTTPTLFINGEEFVGVPPRDLLITRIANLLAATQ